MVKRPSKLSIDDSIAYSIHRFARLLRKNFLHLAQRGDLDITPEQWFVLNKLAWQDGQSQVELCESIFADRPNLTRMLATMERKKLVRRKPDEEDGRKIRVYLTKGGRLAHDRMSEVAEDARKVLFKGLSDEDFATFRRVLSVMEKNMTQM